MNNLDLIERYFENALTADERVKFNDLLQYDEEFKKEFLFRKDLKKVIRNQQNEDLKNTLEEFEQKLHKSSRFMVVPMKWVAAASLVLVLSLGTWAVQNRVYPSEAVVFENYYQPYPNTIVPVVRGEEVNSIEYRAFVAYENGEYHKAINLFNSVDNNSDTDIQFYKAMCLLAVDKEDQAIQLLLPLINESSNDLEELEWSQKAQWYVGLAELKLGNEQEAKFYFNKLHDQQNEFKFKKVEAGEILNYLE